MHRSYHNQSFLGMWGRREGGPSSIDLRLRICTPTAIAVIAPDKTAADATIKKSVERSAPKRVTAIQPRAGLWGHRPGTAALFRMSGVGRMAAPFLAGTVRLLIAACSPRPQPSQGNQEGAIGSYKVKGKKCGVSQCGKSSERCLVCRQTGDYPETGLWEVGQISNASRLVAIDRVRA